VRVILACERTQTIQQARLGAAQWLRIDTAGRSVPEPVKVSRQRNSSSAAQVEYAAAMTASATRHGRRMQACF